VIVTIMQPAYLPWLGYFHRISLCDLFIVLDHVQIDRNSKTGFAHRNKVRTRDGWCWLTVPLRTKGKHGQLYLNQLEIANDQAWAEKHWATLRQNYARAKFFAQHAAALEGIYALRWELLAQLARELTAYQLDAFGIRTPLRFSSEMGVEGAKDELILNLCRAAGAEVYLSGPFGRDYLRAELFEQAGVRIVFHDYNHPSYPQAHPGFEPIMGRGNMDRPAVAVGGTS
jgi:hypothetical protein